MANDVRRVAQLRFICKPPFTQLRSESPLSLHAPRKTIAELSIRYDMILRVSEGILNFRGRSSVKLMRRMASPRLQKGPSLGQILRFPTQKVFPYDCRRLSCSLSSAACWNQRQRRSGAESAPQLTDSALP